MKESVYSLCEGRNGPGHSRDSRQSEMLIQNVHAALPLVILQRRPKEVSACKRVKVRLLAFCDFSQPGVPPRNGASETLLHQETQVSGVWYLGVDPRELLLVCVLRAGRRRL